MRTTLPGIAFLLALATSGAARAQVQIVINNGLAPPDPANVLDADYAPFLFDVFVRNVGCGESFPYDAPCASPGAPTRVALVDGGEINQWLAVYDTSLLDVTGGATYHLRAAGASLAALTGGVVENTLEVKEGATVRLQGTEVGQFLYAYDEAFVAIEAGALGQVLPSGHSRTLMTGGSAGLLSASGFSTVEMGGGVITAFLSGIYGSRIHLRGGQVGGPFVSNELATLTWSGGQVAGRLYAYDDATMLVRGSGFAVDGVPIGDGLVPAQEGILSGTLASGEAFSNSFCHDGCLDEFENPATGLISVPEPAAPAAAAGALAVLRARRRATRPLRGAAS